MERCAQDLLGKILSRRNHECNQCGATVKCGPTEYTEEYKQQLENSGSVDPVAPPTYQQWVYEDVDNDDIEAVYWGWSSHDRLNEQVAHKAFEVIEAGL